LNDRLASGRHDPLFDLDGDGINTALDRLEITQVIGASEIEAMTTHLQQMTYNAAFDLDGNARLDEDDLAMLISGVFHTFFGDSNLDGKFNSSDLIEVFQAGEYEDTRPENSSWQTGDWNGDGDFNSSDLVAAFADGGFEKGYRVAAVAVPEPTMVGPLNVLVVLILSKICWGRRKRKLSPSRSDSTQDDNIVPTKQLI
jgi:hypothetical protein